jgi:hypothetical protein
MVAKDMAPIAPILTPPRINPGDRARSERLYQPLYQADEKSVLGGNSGLGTSN